MSKPSKLTIDLLSDTTFGGGHEYSGVVDTEVEHDLFGLPRVSGKTLHGLLRDIWLSMERQFGDLSASAVRLFGTSWDLDETACLRVGDGCVEEDVIRWIEYATRPNGGSVTPGQILGALTGIRRQTAQDRVTGAPADQSLRSTRVIIRGLRLVANLHWLREPSTEEKRVLALSALGTRNVGLARNRGRGHVCMLLDGNTAQTWLLAGLGVHKQ